MSIQNSNFTNASAVAKPQHPVVLRFASMHPSALARFEMHAARRGGDLSHVDVSKTLQNKLLIGGPDWRKKLEDEIEAARAENLAEELEALLRRKRKKERQARLLKGLCDPWQPSDGGPLREVILTANRLWFEEKPDPASGTGVNRRAMFEARAVEWLLSRFPGQVAHARSEEDEMTFHIHAVIAPWKVDTTQRRGTQKLLVPTANPILENYQVAQDDVGTFFGSIGLVRGKQTKDEQRAVIERKRRRERIRTRIRKAGGEVPEPLREENDPRIPALLPHVPAPVWWKGERKRIELENLRLVQEKARAEAEATRLAHREAELRDQEAKVQAREQDAIGVVEIAEAIAEGRKLQALPSTGSLGGRLIAALQKIRTGMLRSVEARVAEERSAIGALHAAVMGLRDKMFGLLSPVQRDQFERETESEHAGVRLAAERVEVAQRKSKNRAR